MRVLPVGTRRIRWSGLLLLAVITAWSARAQNQEPDQKHELTFSIGGIPDQTRSFQGSAGGRKSPRIAVLELTTAIVSWGQRWPLSMAKLNL